MPHTSRRKKQVPTKRVEVLDDEGWTRVTTTRGKRNTPRHNHARPFPTHLGLVKTTPEKGATVGKITKEYERVREQWHASEACKALGALLKQRTLIDCEPFDKCLMFGSGSFCGLRQGWIQRKETAMCQLTVIETVRRAIEEGTGQAPLVYAQEPAYNDLDLEFLKTQDVEVAESPSGFDLITEKSMVYTPGAEMEVELAVLRRTPAALLTGKLDWYWRNESGQACTDRVESIPQDDKEADRSLQDDSNQRLEQECRDLETFLGKKQGSRLPEFELRDQHPFHNMHLYWSRAQENGEGGETVDVVQ